MQQQQPLACMVMRRRVYRVVRCCSQLYTTCGGKHRGHPGIRKVRADGWGRPARVIALRRQAARLLQHIHTALPLGQRRGEVGVPAASCNCAFSPPAWDAVAPLPRYKSQVPLPGSRPDGLPLPTGGLLSPGGRACTLQARKAVQRVNYTERGAKAPAGR